MAKKIILGWGVGVVVALYITFVLQNLWNWFVVAAFHTSEISFWIMYGIVLTVGMLTEQDRFMEDQQLKTMMAMVDACIPEDRRKGLNEKLEWQADFGSWLEVGLRVIGKVLGGTIVLVIGWSVHTFLV